MAHLIFPEIPKVGTVQDSYGVVFERIVDEVMGNTLRREWRSPSGTFFEINKISEWIGDTM